MPCVQFVYLVLYRVYFFASNGLSCVLVYYISHGREINLQLFKIIEHAILQLFKIIGLKNTK